MNTTYVVFKKKSFIGDVYVPYGCEWYHKNSHPENSHQSNSFLVNPPRKIPSQKIPTWNITTHVFKYSHPGFLIFFVFSL